MALRFEMASTVDSPTDPPRISVKENYICSPINDNIPGMGTRRIIALTVGAVVTLTVFFVVMGAFVFGGLWPEDRVLVFASIALAPVLLIAAIMGYGAWWLVMFILALFSPDEDSEESG